jgi:protoheme IX farnesyltransferase
LVAVATVASATDRSVPRSTFADLVELTKPRIALLVLITCAGAMIWAAGGVPHVDVALGTLAGMALASGGSGALNHAIDRDIDALMTRTQSRPVAAGRIAPRTAAAFGILLTALGVSFVALGGGWLAAVLTLAGSLFYVVVYTMVLKRRTPQNIVIGGAAGAVPPLVGWAAVTGSLALAPIVMFAIIFLWTPPHFWALAILKREDYARAGVPMLPVVASPRATALQILAYTVVLGAVSLVPVATGELGIVYLAVAVALGGRFVQLAVRLLRDRTPAAARATFLFSLLYLAALFTAMGADRVVASL